MKPTISSPCPMAWESLPGDDRVRFCGRCRLNVYNLADLPDGEVEDLVRRTEGRLCGRLYRREDGTATAADCGWARQRRWVKRAAVAAVVLVLSAAGLTLAAGAAAAARPESRIAAWVKSCLRRMGWMQPRREVLGEIAPPPGFRKCNGG